MEKQNDVHSQAMALIHTCTAVLRSKSYGDTVPDLEIAAHAMRVLSAAKAQVPKNELLAAFEIQSGSWSVLLAAMHCVLQAVPYGA